MKIRKILVMFCVLALIFTSDVYAENNLKYYLSGQVESITANHTTVSYYLGGDIESISTEEFTLTQYMNENIEEVKVQSGKISFNLDGSLYSVDGDYTKICNDACKALNKAFSEITNYISTIKIQVPGAETPEDSVKAISDSFSKILNKLSTNTNVSNLTNTTISDSSDIISATETSTQTNEVAGILEDADGVNINDGNEVEITIDENGLSAGYNKKENKLLKYLIIMTVFFLLLVIIVFAVIINKKKKHQIKVKEK